MEINDDEDMGSSPPLEVKRKSKEKNELIDPIHTIEPIDAPTDIVVSHKRPRWAQ